MKSRVESLGLGIYFVHLSTALLYLALLAGCAVTKPGPEIVPPPDVDSILATLKMRYDLVDSLRTWMNVKIESRGQTDEIREYLRYEKPDKLRVDAMGPFNNPKVIVLAVQRVLKIYFVTENELMVGELSDDVIRDTFDVDVRVSDVRSSIFANPFLDGDIKGLELKSYDDEYVIRRESSLPGHREEIWILARDITVSKWQIKDAEGELVQEITFSRYRKVGEILRPLKAVIHRPADGTRLVIESVSPEINVEMQESDFSLPIPEDTKIYQLSED